MTRVNNLDKIRAALRDGGWKAKPEQPFIRKGAWKLRPGPLHDEPCAKWSFRGLTWHFPQSCAGKLEDGASLHLVDHDDTVWAVLRKSRKIHGHFSVVELRQQNLTTSEWSLLPVKMTPSEQGDAVNKALWDDEKPGADVL